MPTLDKVTNFRKFVGSRICMKKKRKKKLLLQFLNYERICNVNKPRSGSLALRLIFNALMGQLIEKKNYM